MKTRHPRMEEAGTHNQTVVERACMHDPSAAFHIQAE